MKIAFLILCHKNPAQINCLIDTLNDEDVSFYLHIDKKSNIESKIKKGDNIYFLSDDKRLDIRWGQNQMIHATVGLIEEALKSNIDYDYYWFLSGQDFPIKSISYIKQYLDKDKSKNYIDLMSKDNKLYRRFLKRNELKYAQFMANQNLISTIIKHLYILITGGPYKTLILKRKNVTGLEFNFGSSWWILTNDCIKYMSNKLKNNSCIMKYFDNAICPDESLFQSIFATSPYLESQTNIPILIDWDGQNKHPKTFTINDYSELCNSKYLMARKFDENIDNKIIEKLSKELLNKGDY